LRTGASVKGKYVRFAPARPSDVESYLVIRQLRRGSESLQSVALSDVRSIGVEAPDYSYIGIGALIGLVVDVLAVTLLTDRVDGLSD
jgi:hypothetical protein